MFMPACRLSCKDAAQSCGFSGIYNRCFQTQIYFLIIFQKLPSSFSLPLGQKWQSLQACFCVLVYVHNFGFQVLN